MKRTIEKHAGLTPSDRWAIAGGLPAGLSDAASWRGIARKLLTKRKLKPAPVFAVKPVRGQAAVNPAIEAVKIERTPGARRRFFQSKKTGIGSVLEPVESRRLYSSAPTAFNVALIDDSLPGSTQLLRAVTPQERVILFDGRTDSAEQVLDKVLQWSKANHVDLKSLSILSHGSHGAFELGRDWINPQNLGQNSPQWQQIGRLLNEGGGAGSSINLYACDVVGQAGNAADVGQGLINQLANLTGSTVRASTNLTGHRGDWTLEATSNNANAVAAPVVNAVQVAHLANYRGDLSAKFVGSETRANTTTSDIQTTINSTRAVAMDSSGNYVVVWSSNNQDGSGYSAFGQLFHANGTPNGSEFEISTNSGWEEQNVTVAMLPGGGFVVAWTDNKGGSDLGVRARIFNPSGVATTGLLQCNTYTASDQSNPSIAVDANGNFTVVWQSNGQDGSGWGIYGKRFNSAGSVIGSEFKVNTTTAGDQTNPTVAMMPSGTNAGQFVVTWTSPDANGTGIFAQRYDASGNALGSQFQINSTTTGNQSNPSVACSLNGTFVVSWQSFTTGGTGLGIFARRFNWNGTAIGSDFQVSQYSPSSGGQQLPNAAMDSSGAFTIVWQSNGQDGGGQGIYGRMYDSSGNAWGNEFRVNTTTSGDQTTPSVAMSGSGTTGNFVVAWSGNGTGDSAGVFTQRFGANVAPTITAPTATQTTYGVNPVIFNSANGNLISVADTDANGSSEQITLVASHGALTLASTSGLTFSSGDGTDDSVMVFSGTIANLNTALAGMKFIATSGYGGAASFSVSINDLGNSGEGGALTASKTVNLTVTAPSITVTPTGGLSTSTSGGTATFSVKLNGAPTSNVTISLTSSDTAQGTVSTSLLTFTSANWNTAQTVTITGQNNHIANGNQAYQINLGPASSSDANYSGMSLPSVSVTNVNNNVAGVTVTPTSGLQTSQSGSTAQFSIVLTSKPTANVTINLSSSDTTQGTLSSSSIVFTSSNWNVAQTVTITGQDNQQAQGNIGYTIVTSNAVSTDTNYGGLNVADVSVNNQGIHTAGVTVTPISGLQTTQAGGTAAFSVVLTSKPTANVTINLSSSDTTQGTLSTNAVVFTSSNWNIAQTVTVTGVDNQQAQGNVAYAIVTSNAISTDSNYNNMTVADVSVHNQGIHTAGVTVTPTSGLQTTQAGGTATFSVVLTSKPTANVTINLSSSDTTQGTVSASSLVFTASNWNVAQTVTATGVDNQMAQGNVAYTIVTSNAISTDTNYSGLAVADVSVRNQGIHTAGITVSPTSLTTNENGSTATFTVVLTSKPAANVTIGLTVGNTAEGSLSTTSLLFTAANWNVAKTVTVTGLDDHVYHGDQTYQIAVGPAVSSDGNYSGMSGATVTVVNQERDDAAPTVTPSGATNNYVENASAQTIDGGITLTDANDTTTASATVWISGNFSAGQDMLQFTNQNGIAGNYNAATGVLTLTGTATVAQYQQALRSIAYVNTSENPSGATRTISFKTSDGTLDSNIATVQMQVTPVDDAPVLVNNTGVTLNQGGTVTITSAMLQASDVDSASNQLAYVLDSVPQNGTLYDNGIALGAGDSFTQADLDAGLITLSQNNSRNASDSFTFEISDGAGGMTGPANFNITVTLSNLPPVLVSPIGDQTAQRGHGFNFQFSDGTFRDPENAALSYTATLSDGAALPAWLQFDASTRTFTGTPPPGSLGAIAVTVTANDGYGGLTADTFQIQVINVDLPILSGGGQGSYTSGNSGVIIAPNLVLRDAVDPLITQAVVAITGNFDPGEDVLAFTDQNGISGNWNSATGVLTLTGTATVTQYQAALRSISFSDLNNAAAENTRGFTIRVSDEDATSAALSSALVVSDPYQLPAGDVPNDQTLVTGQTLTFSSATGNAISLLQLPDDAAVQVELSVGHGALTLATEAGLTFALQSPTVLRFTGTVADANRALQGLRFVPDAGFAGDTTVYFSISGGSAHGQVPTVSSSIRVHVLVPGDELVSPPPVTIPPDAHDHSFDDDSRRQGGGELVKPPTVHYAGERTGTQLSSGSPTGGGAASANESVARQQSQQSQNLIATVGSPSQQIGGGLSSRLFNYIDPSLVTAPPIAGGGVTLTAKAMNIATPQWLAQLDNLKRQLDSGEDSLSMFTGAITGVSAAATIGYVVWLVRGGTLLTSLLATVPTWQWFDPLPVLDSKRRDARRRRAWGFKPDDIPADDLDEQRLEELVA